MKTDALIVVLLIFVAVFATWLGVAGPLVDSITARGWIAIIWNWQTLIAAALALGAAWYAGFPVWRQLKHMRAQSAVGFYEYLLERDEAMESAFETAWRSFKLAEAIHTYVVQVADAPCNHTYIALALAKFESYEADISSIVDELTARERNRWDKWFEFRSDLTRSLIELHDRVSTTCGRLRVAAPVGLPAHLPLFPDLQRAAESVTDRADRLRKEINAKQAGLHRRLERAWTEMWDE